MALVKATFYLPVQDNDGSDLASDIAEVENDCFVAFGGWTLSGYFKGTWRMEGGVCHVDTSAVYMVVLDASQLVELEAILLRFKGKTTQEKLYLEVEHNVDVRFL
jgi:hypothetical protein